MSKKTSKLILWLDKLRETDIPIVGGKSANLGELSKCKVPLPKGFVVTAYAYKRFIEENNLSKDISQILKELDVKNIANLRNVSERIRKKIEEKPIPNNIRKAIEDSYEGLSKKTKANVMVSVRSSATAEDLPGASFAGQQETYLYVGKEQLVEKVKKCWGSLFTSRAISYRTEKGFDHEKVLIAVIVHEMVAQDPQAQGVIFTIHPSTGDNKKILIESNYGLGESVVSGAVTPDTFTIDKDSLKIIGRQIGRKAMKEKINRATGRVIEIKVAKKDQEKQSITNKQIIGLAKYAKRIEEYYKKAMDIEWAIDKDGSVYILQARPETVWSEKIKKEKPKEKEKKITAEILTKGLPVGPGVGYGNARVILTVKEIDKINEGDVLVTKMTTPSWAPAMKKASAIVTDEGGYTCHAAIVSREMGVPCVVGAGNATKVIMDNENITVDGGKGLIYYGCVKELIESAKRKKIVKKLPKTETKIYVNLSIPEIADKIAKETKADGVGLLRAEHMMLAIGKHPRKLIEEGGEELMIKSFAEGIRRVGKAFKGKPVVYRFLDFKPDEFLALHGGKKYEKDAGHVGPNPMIGYRGQFRYIKEPDIFRLECKAVKKVRDEFGLKNIRIMVPFVRTLNVFKQVKQILKEEGLDKEKDKTLKLWIMVEVPSSFILIDKFCQEGIDGISFGTNDLCMLILGIDRNDASIQELYDERNLAVLRALIYTIKICKKYNVTTSICGQAPSVYPELADFLVRQGVTSMSVNPDVVISTRMSIAKLEEEIKKEKHRKKTYKLRNLKESDIAFWNLIKE